jgi:sec-independent protein translocase protein TatA
MIWVKERKMPNLGPTELIIILVIVIIVFGVGRLPEVGGAVGRAIREFRHASEGDKESAEAPSEEKSRGEG